MRGILASIVNAVPSRLGAGEDEINKVYTGGGDSSPLPAVTYPEDIMPQSYNVPATSDLTPEAQMLTQMPTTNYLTPAGVQVDLPEPTPSAAVIQQTYGPVAAAAPSSTGAAQVAVSPSTSEQIFNLINTVAKGFLDIKQTEAQTKLSTAAAAAAAEASKIQAQNYVMQQLQQGKQVMVPESWLTKYTQSDSLTKWLTPILIIGGVALLAYALWKYSKGKGSGATSKTTSPAVSASMASAALNPGRRKFKVHRRSRTSKFIRMEKRAARRSALKGWSTRRGK